LILGIEVSRLELPLHVLHPAKTGLCKAVERYQAIPFEVEQGPSILLPERPNQGAFQHCTDTLEGSVKRYRPESKDNKLVSRVALIAPSLMLQSTNIWYRVVLRKSGRLPNRRPDSRSVD
jgi:hypothetical protein